MTSRERRAIQAAAAGGLAATAWAIERRRHRSAGSEQSRYLQRIAADPEYQFLSAPALGRTTPIRSFDGTVLHAEVFGPEDAPTIVLAHGWTEALRIYIHQIANLSLEGGYRVVAYDLRGHGLSTKARTDDYSLAAFGDDLEAVLRQAVPADQRAVVVGHSLGAMSIASWAERHDVSERASAAALLCTGFVDLLTEHQIFRPPWLPAAMFKPVSEFVLGAPGAIPAFSPQLLDAVIRYVAFGPTAGPAQVAFYQRMLRDCPPDVRRKVAAAMAKMDLFHAVERLTVPTLVVAGAEDRLTPPSHARKIAAALPNPVEIIELPRTGHMAPLERPVEVNAWLRKLASRANGAAESSPGAFRAA